MYVTLLDDFMEICEGELAVGGQQVTQKVLTLAQNSHYVCIDLLGDHEDPYILLPS